MANEDDEARITKGVLLELQEVYRWFKRTGTSQIQQALDALDGSDFAPPEWVILTENLTPGSNAKAELTKWDGNAHVSKSLEVEIYDPHHRNFGIIGDVFQVQLNRRNSQLECVGESGLVRIGKTTGTITAGSSGTVNVWTGSTAAETNPVVALTAHLDWMHGSEDISSGKEVQVRYFTDAEKWRITGAECE
jgi:hypothetical protein